VIISTATPLHVVDLIAGTALAFVFVPIGDRIYDRMMRRPRTA
jgi:hypothetical protein